MKRVSLEIARAIKEAGYDEPSEYGYCVVDGVHNLVKTEEEWERHIINNSEMQDFLRCTCQEEEGKDDCVAPTYMEVWLWLWREKKVYIELLHDVVIDCADTGFGQGKDPEEAIIAAIEYLVENDLIK